MSKAQKLLEKLHEGTGPKPLTDFFKPDTYMKSYKLVNAIATVLAKEFSDKKVDSAQAAELKKYFGLLNSRLFTYWDTK